MEIIEPETANRLAKYGVRTIPSLLERCRTLEEQRTFAHGIGLSSRRIAQWVRRADLARIAGIGGEYVALLEAVGIESAMDLASRNPAELQRTLSVLNKRRRKVKRVPAVSNVEKWVHDAAKLPPLYQSMTT